jgi:hypothetical protein
MSGSRNIAAMRNRCNRCLSHIVLGVIVAISFSAQAEPKFQLDPTGKRGVLISDLYNDPTCSARQFRGMVVKRLFDGLSLNASGWIVRGPQMLGSAYET